MSISLKVLAPNQNVYEGDAEEVSLPSTTGQIGVLPGHISLVTAIDVRNFNGKYSIFINNGKEKIDLSLDDWVKKINSQSQLSDNKR